MTPERADELVQQQAERDAVKKSDRLERAAGRSVNLSFSEQDKKPFGKMPPRITTEVAPVPFEGEDIETCGKHIQIHTNGLTTYIRRCGQPATARHIGDEQLIRCDKHAPDAA